MKEEKRGVGRPTKYNPDMCEKAYKLCLLGATDERIADFFDVSTTTLNNWKHEYPEFLASIKAGKEEADAVIAQSLFHRAKGYSHDAVKIFNQAGEIIEAPYTEHYPPDTTAAIFWLKNRQPRNWRDKQDIEHSGNIGREMSDEDLDDAIAKRMNAGGTK